LGNGYIRAIAGEMMKNTKAQSTVEFTFAMIAIIFLIYGMVQVFRWAGMDLANRRVAQDIAMTTPVPSSSPYSDGSLGNPAAQLNGDVGTNLLPMSAIYHGSITGNTSQ